MSIKDAQDIFLSAIRAVQPGRLMHEHVSIDEDKLVIGAQTFELHSLRKVIVVGGGKASAAMAAALEEQILPLISTGIVITKYEHALPLQKITCVEAGHPVPDQNGIKATARLLQLLNDLHENDLVIFLVSGGASALMVDTPHNVSLDQLQELVKQLLACGANIDEINCVRKHLSVVKGGQLSRLAFPASLVSLILSDVNGDDLSVIASGPTVGDPSTFADAINVLRKYNLEEKVSPAIFERLQAGMLGKVPETIKPGDPIFSKTNNLLIGTNMVSLKAAAGKATELGYHVAIINDKLNGEAADEAANFVNFCLRYDGPKPACLLMGGETTVTIRGQGLGGRNQHFALAALDELIRQNIDPSLVPIILSGGTDGTDGPTDATGAVVSADQLSAGAQASRFLDDNDAYHFFETYGGLIKTGPTQTNVMDVVIALVQ